MEHLHLLWQKLSDTLQVQTRSWAHPHVPLSPKRCPSSPELTAEAAGYCVCSGVWIHQCHYLSQRPEPENDVFFPWYEAQLHKLQFFPPLFLLVEERGGHFLFVIYLCLTDKPDASDLTCLYSSSEQGWMSSNESLISIRC